MFQHKHWITRFVVFLILFGAIVSIVGGMWGIAAGMVVLALVKAVEKETRRKWAEQQRAKEAP